MEQTHSKNYLDGDLPPGTVYLKDAVTSEIILAPQPSSDPNQPLNWSTKRKVLHMGLLCTYTTLIFSMLCIMPPVWQNIMDETGVSTTILSYSYGTAYCTLTVACVFFIPLSSTFGRRPVYLLTALIAVCSLIWMSNLNTPIDAIGSNLLSGVAGAINEALFQVTICDLFFVHQRGTMTGIYLMVVIFGTYLSPVAAGYIAVSQGWRWVFYYCAIFMGATFLCMIFALEETKFELSTIIGQRSFTNSAMPPTDVKLDEKDQSPTLQQVQSCGSFNAAIPLKSYRQRHAFITRGQNGSRGARGHFKQIYQPFIMLGIFPAVMFSALQYAWSESMLSFLAVTQATLYPMPPYNFSSVGIGNMNIPPAIGAILGSLFGGVFSDYLILRIAARRGGIFEPEYRLWTFMIPGMSMVIGVLLYGLTIARGMPWIINAIGAGFIGFALGGCGDIALTYVQDSYDGIIGPALTGIVFVRNGMATVMTFVIPVWISGMGVYKMFLLLGVLAALVALTCVPFLVYGKYWRMKLADRYTALSR